MSRESLVFILGVLLVVIPFLGVPESWRAYTIASIGALLAVVGYSLRRARYFNTFEKDGERVADSFVETTESLFDDNTLQ